MSVADRLRTLRDEKGLTQEATARAIGVALRSYCGWEEGRTKPRPENLLKLARFFEKPMEWFLEETPKEGD